MKIPLVSILYGINAIILFFFSFRLFLAYRKSLNPLSRYFRNMSFFSGIGMAIYSGMTFLFPKNSFALGVGNILGEIFFYLTFIYGLSMFFYSINSGISQRKIFFFGIIALIFAIAIHIIFFPSPFIDEKGILHFNNHFWVGIIYHLFAIFGLWPLGFLFSWQAITKKEIRKRSILLATAIWMISLLAPLFFDKGKTIEGFFLQTLGFIFLFWGALIK